MTATRDQLVGTWRLVSWETRYQDGSVIHPMGDAADGFLVYAADGYMAATLSRSNRPAFTTGEMMTADVQEKARGWDSYFSYVGRYEIGDGQITHHIEVSHANQPPGSAGQLPDLAPRLGMPPASLWWPRFGPLFRSHGPQAKLQHA